MAATQREAMDSLLANGQNHDAIIHALRTWTDDFVEASFDAIERATRNSWVSATLPLIRYLVDKVGWVSRPNASGRVCSSPWGTMIRPLHHTLKKPHGGIWVAASWKLRARARRAWDGDEIKAGEL